MYLKLYAGINKFFVVVKPKFIRPRNASITFLNANESMNPIKRYFHPKIMSCYHSSYEKNSAKLNTILNTIEYKIEYEYNFADFFIFRSVRT